VMRQPPGMRCEDNIKNKIGREDVDRIELAKNTEKQRDFVNAVPNL
jgi:hypothetical protein